MMQSYPPTEKPVVVITGSTGRIGSALARSLADQYDLYGLDITIPEEKLSWIQWLQCDLTSDESVAAAMSQLRETAGGRIASVVHLAAYYDFAGEPSPLYQELTVEGTRRLLDQLQRFEVGQFVFSSSMLVMKPAEEEGARIDENSPTEASWDYPESKLDAERVIREHRGEIAAVSLRIAGAYDEDCNSIPIAQQIKRIYERDFESHFFPGDLSRGQPFIHLDDVASSIACAIAKRAQLEGFTALLVAEDELLSYGELQDCIGKQLYGREWTTVRIPEMVARAGSWVKNALGEDEFIKPWMIEMADDHYPLDCSLAKRSLDWSPKRRLSETLPEMLRRLKEDPARWYEINGLGEPPTLKDEIHSPPARPVADVAADQPRAQG
ncbi:NAD-dependent epimerase/dehydratase family protein [Botrimarina mediterranea]|uniref:Short chain dehydrogenase n=1 Tax=Botrimarina mediterranea TaxID=2528022 RepID=A0A518K4A3_9BACT|nr:NAD(P)-dependent oxidoreductase [Botrimarina mediterranea]QDV72621.1 short chain dehydrogenase [Botrimarina mediterranea]QDV77193.1 short chain dehydrogenase [Planctomycetes bacterium K2D]